MPGFGQVLEAVADAWRERRDGALSAREQAARARSAESRPGASGDEPIDRRALEGAVEGLRERLRRASTAASAARPSSRRHRVIEFLLRRGGERDDVG